MRPIDADALKDNLIATLAVYRRNARYDKTLVPYKRVIEIISSAPTIEPKHGEWIDAEIPLECGGSMPVQVCNLCKTFYPLAYTGGGHHFCPNCGARMKGADDED